MLIHHALGARHTCLSTSRQAHSLTHWGTRRISLRAALDSEAPSRHLPEEPDPTKEDGAPPTASNGSALDVPNPSSNREEVERWLQELGMSEVCHHHHVYRQSMHPMST